MRKTVCAFLLVGLIFLPATAVAKPLDDSSVRVEAAIRNSDWFLQIKGWFDRVNAWLEETLGIDFYYLMGLAVDFAVAGTRLAIDFAFRALAQLREFLF
jgi:hypothetical protein